MKDFAVHISDTIDQVIASAGGFLPELLLVLGFVLSIVASLLMDRRWRGSSFVVFMATLLSSACCLAVQMGLSGETHFFGMVLTDHFSVLSRYIVLFGVAISGVYLFQYRRLSVAKVGDGDVYPILLAVTLGLHLLTMTTHWLLAFVALELVSIGSYILVAFYASDRKQTEASMKYLLFGAVCTAFMLYGLSLLYGLSGSLDFASMDHIKGLIAAPKMMVSLALLFVFVGFGFKLSFVPFHFWTPDVYDGAPTPVVAFLSTVPKVAGVVLFSRLIGHWASHAFYFGELTLYVLIALAVVTMLLGNLAALRQDNMKRMMAYSSIGHTGILLMAALAYAKSGEESLLFYLAVYTIMNLAAFGFIEIIRQKIGGTDFDVLIGTGRQYPYLFVAFTIVGVALVGLPPTAGFVGKLLVISQVFELYQDGDDIGYLLLLVSAVLTSLISLFYYLKIPMYAFLKRKNNDPSVTAVSGSVWFNVLLTICVFLTILLLIFGLFPSLLFG